MLRAFLYEHKAPKDEASTRDVQEGKAVVALWPTETNPSLASGCTVFWVCLQRKLFYRNISSRKGLSPFIAGFTYLRTSFHVCFRCLTCFMSSHIIGHEEFYKRDHKVLVALQTACNSFFLDAFGCLTLLVWLKALNDVNNTHTVHVRLFLLYCEKMHFCSVWELHQMVHHPVTTVLLGREMLCTQIGELKLFGLRGRAANQLLGFVLPEHSSKSPA